MADISIKSIGLFIDGGYYADIDKGLLPEGRRLNLKGVIKYLQKTIAEKYGLTIDQCIVTESHFYRGRFRTYDAKKAGRLESDRAFEDRLIENDVVFHYKHIRELEDGSLKEKGIDVWFALEAYELAMYSDFDFVVLVTGDADYEMLARKIKALKKQVVLLTWNFDDKDSTSPALREEVTFHIDLKKITTEHPELKQLVCQGASR